MGKWDLLTKIDGVDIAYNDLLLLSNQSETDGTQDRNVTVANLAIAVHKFAVTETSHGLSVGDSVRHNGTGYVEATADTTANAEVIGLVVQVIDTDTFVLQQSGFTDTQSGLTAGEVYYLQDAGGLGATAGTVSVPIGVATSTTELWLLPISQGGGGASNLNDLGDVDTATQTPTTGDGFRYDGSNYTPVKNNLAATAAPTGTDDSSSDYEVGSWWIDTTNDKAYVCLDATASSAVWTEITSTSGSGDMTKAVYDTNDDGTVDAADVAERVEETSSTTAASGTTETLDLSTASVFNVTLTGNCTFTFSNSPSDSFGFTLILQQDGTGSRTATWPASVDWAGGTAPTLTTTASAVDILTFITDDGGTTWYGFPAGLDFS